jgi:hypothetical protein
MSTKDANLSKRATGFAMGLPDRTLRIVDLRITMNAVGKSQSTTNNRMTPDAFSFDALLLRSSRIANGRTTIKLRLAANVKSLVMVL